MMPVIPLHSRRRAVRRARPRVVFLDHCARLSGAEIALIRLLESMRTIQPLVLLAEDGPLVARLADIGVRARVVPLEPVAAGVQRAEITTRRLPWAALGVSAAYTVRLAGLLRQIAPDIVHTNSMKAHLYGGVAAAMAGIPHVWHARDRAAPDYLPPPAVGLVRAAARTLPTVLVANSRSTLDTYPGVRDSEVLYCGAPAHHRQRTRAGAPPVVRIGVVGRLTPWKGQHVFLQAFAAAFAGGPQHAVIIGAPLFGDHDYGSELEDLARRLGIAEQVEFVGFTDDVASQLDTLDVLVHCSTIPEPFGQVVVEGMAAGLAVVAAAAGGPAELVDDGRTGLLVAPGDVEALTATLKRLAGDADLRAHLGRAARASSTAWRPEHCAQRLTAVYQRALSGAAPSDLRSS